MPPLTPQVVVQALLVLAVGLTYVMLVRQRPRIGVIVTLAVLGLIPIWIGGRFVVFISLCSAVAGATALALITRRVPRWSMGDLLMAFLLLCALAPLVTGHLTIGSAFGVLTYWLAGYAFGRLSMDQIPVAWVYTCAAVVFSVVAVLAVVEFVARWHGLSAWGPYNELRMAWGRITGRGSLERSEGAFGHSIALGASLAMAVPMAIESLARPAVRVAIVAILSAGVAATLSRTGLLCLATVLALSIVFLTSERARAIRPHLIVVSLLAALVIVPFQLSALAEDEASSASAEYRGDLFSLLPSVDLMGTSPAMQVSSTGTVYFGQFRSIDSQFVLFGLSYGWFALGMLLLLLGYLGWSLLSLRATAAEVAVIAQVPALLTVALITQYALFFWIALGFAVAARDADRRTRIKGAGSGASVHLDGGEAIA